jgi:pimeloyl-ACP methyl ester carboxylesterase
VNGLRDRFRCIALDYPGFGLSTAPPGYRYTFPNHRTVILQGASHYIQEDAPEEILAAISKWWPGE